MRDSSEARRRALGNAEGGSYLSGREEPASEAASDGARKRAQAPGARGEARQLAARERARLGSLELAGRRPPRERHRASSPAAYRGGRRLALSLESKPSCYGGAIRGLLVYAHLHVTERNLAPPLSGLPDLCCLHV